MEADRVSFFFADSRDESIPQDQSLVDFILV